MKRVLCPGAAVKTVHGPSTSCAGNPTSKSSACSPPSTVNSTVSPCTARAVRCSKRSRSRPAAAVDRPAALALLQRNLRGTHGRKPASERSASASTPRLRRPVSPRRPHLSRNQTQANRHRAAVSSMEIPTDELAHTMIGRRPARQADLRRSKQLPASSPAAISIPP